MLWIVLKDEYWPLDNGKIINKFNMIEVNKFKLLVSEFIKINKTKILTKNEL